MSLYIMSCMFLLVSIRNSSIRLFIFILLNKIKFIRIERMTIMSVHDTSFVLFFFIVACDIFVSHGVSVCV